MSAGDQTPGVRLADGFHGTPARGAYWLDEHGEWSVCTPNGRIGGLGRHTVTEHPDRTITVSPSILVEPIPPVEYSPAERASLEQLARESTDGFAEAFQESYGIAPGADRWPGRPGWHGFLVEGRWSEV